jgi:competence protein ComEA
MKRFLLQNLYFARSERKGLVFLALLAAAIYLLPWMLRPFYQRPPTDFSRYKQEIQQYFDNGQIRAEAALEATVLFEFNPNTARFEEFVQLGLSEKTARSICNYRDKGGQFRKPEDFSKIYTLSKSDFERLLPYIRLSERAEKDGMAETGRKEKLPPELFAFDPNTASEAELRRLGLPERTARSIANYRSKGGRFKTKTDLQKIYTLAEEDYERLEPFVQIAAAPAPPPPTEGIPRAATYSGGGGFPTKKAAFTGVLDINRAALEHWQQLPGIGEKRARQIVNFREKLGGFLSVGQVAETWGLPDSVFQNIKPLLVLEDRSIRTLNLNAASIEDLDAHPYISPKQAELIVRYREQNGAYGAVEDLVKIAAFKDKGWMERVRAYLSVK